MDRRREWILAALISAMTFAIWSLARDLGDTPFNHYVRLAYAMLHGTMDLGVGTPDYLELARVNGHFWVIDPPAPALFCLPFVALFGPDVSQRLICMAVGAAAVGGLWILTGRLHLCPQIRWACVILGAFGSNLWWAATDAGLWTFANTAAAFFLTFALVEWSGKNRAALVGVLVGLAGLSRIPCFLAFLFFAWDYLRIRRIGWRPVVELASVLAVFTAVLLAINQYQYGSPLITGWNHGQYEDQPWFAQGRFNVSYVPRHLRAIFAEPWQRSDSFPWLVPNHVGTAVTLTSPALFMGAMARGRRATATGIGVAFISVLWLLHGTTGWAQFGYRYLLDAWPLLLMAVGYAMSRNRRIAQVSWGLIAISVAANAWGTYATNRLGS